MTEREEFNTPVIAVVGLISVILVMAMIGLVIVIFYRAEARQHAVKVVDPTPFALSDLVARQEGQLADYRLVDPEQGAYTIPIRRAMDLVADELAADPQAARKPLKPAEGQEGDDGL